jgi:hypothetical protein
MSKWSGGKRIARVWSAPAVSELRADGGENGERADLAAVELVEIALVIEEVMIVRRDGRLREVLPRMAPVDGCGAAPGGALRIGGSCPAVCDRGACEDRQRIDIANRSA